MLSPDLQRVAHILDYCVEIEKTIERYGRSFEVFDQDADYQRSISFSIMQIGELSSKLSAEYRGATASRIQWGPIKGMRNLIVHDYGTVDLTIVCDTVFNSIPELYKELKGLC